jgi:hypothetical protein
MADLLPRLGALLAGVAALVVFAQSAARAALINRHRGDRLANTIARLVFSAVSRTVPTRRHYDAIQDACAWVLPLYMVALIASWFVLVQVGFALLLWAARIESSLLQALIASGSALSTLGFLTPPHPFGQFLAILEGATGLGVVVFFFTFIPGYQATLQARELQVSWLYSRAGSNPCGFSLIEWLHEPGNSSDPGSLWEDWETWFQLLSRSLALAPVLTFVPTYHRGQTWLAAAATILDTTSFYISTLEGAGLPQASVCRTVGVEALRLLARPLDSRSPPVPNSETCDCARLLFDVTCMRIAALGAPVSADLDASWKRFIALREEYEDSLAILAQRLLIPTEESVLRPFSLVSQ